MFDQYHFPFPEIDEDNKCSIETESYTSDLSDSDCSETKRRNARNQCVIGSPPAFLMKNSSPPSVIYNGVINDVQSFQTTYSADVTEADTLIDGEVEKARDMSVQLSAVDEVSTECSNDMSVYISVIDQEVLDKDEETGIEIDYEQKILFSASQSIKQSDKELEECVSSPVKAEEYEATNHSITEVEDMIQVAEVTSRATASEEGFICASPSNENEQLSSLEKNGEEDNIKSNVGDDIQVTSLDRDDSVKKPIEGNDGSTKSIAVGVVAVAAGAAIAGSITAAVNAFRMQYSKFNNAEKTGDVHECDENFTIESIVLSSEDTYDLSVESEHSLFAKLFSCGGQGKGDYSLDSASHKSNEEKIEELKRKYEDSMKRRKQEEQERETILNDTASKSNVNRKALVKSTVIAKTKLYPGFEVTNRHGKQKVSTNSKTRAIKDMVKMLKRNKVSKKKGSGKPQIENNDSSVLLNKKTILERVTISTS